MKVSFTIKKQAAQKSTGYAAGTLFLLALGLIAPVLPTSAATTATVTATVTVQNISVSVSDGSVAYGILSTSSTNDTTSGNLDDSQSATNDGNVSVDFNIRGQDTADWTLASSVGADQYKHDFCTTDCDSSPQLDRPHH